jgi:tetratricopeptide (TPR) repeat protein
MKYLNQKFTGFFLMLFALAFAIYVMGCASAETTTGKLAFQQRDYVKAEIELEKGLQKNPNDAEAWYMLGYSQFQNGKMNAAHVSLTKAASLSPTYKPYLIEMWGLGINEGVKVLNRGVDFFNKKDSLKARSEFLRARDYFSFAKGVNPDSIQSYQFLADAYTLLGHNDSALALYDFILARTSSAEDAERAAKLLYNSATNAAQNKDYTNAAIIYDRILNITGLPKTNEYYIGTLFDAGYNQYQIALTKESKSEYEPYLRKSLEYLEPYTLVSNNKETLKSSYLILIEVYEALNMDDKKADAQAKLNSLQ